MLRVPKATVAELKTYLEARALRRIERASPGVGLRSPHAAEVLLPANDAPASLRPLYGSLVPAGFPSPADDYIQDFLDLNSLLIADKPATFFVRVKGDSMIEEGIRPNDILVVDKGMEAISGTIVIAVVDGELTVKRLEIRGQRVRLIPANSALQPMELRDGQTLMVWGVVTACIHQFY